MKVNFQLTDLGLPDLTNIGVKFDTQNWVLTIGQESMTPEQAFEKFDAWIREINTPKVEEVKTQSKPQEEQESTAQVPTEPKTETPVPTAKVDKNFSVFGDVSGAQAGFNNLQKQASDLQKAAALRAKVKAAQQKANQAKTTQVQDASKSDPFVDFFGLNDLVSDTIGGFESTFAQMGVEMDGMTQEFSEAFDTIDDKYKEAFEDLWTDSMLTNLLTVDPQSESQKEDNLIPAKFQVRDPGMTIPTIISDSEDFRNNIATPFVDVSGRIFLFNGEKVSKERFIVELLKDTKTL
jgi:hypothetical protein